jgi:hypothetical protein
MYGYRRRNPKLSATEIAAVAEQMGFGDLSALLRMGGDTAAQLVAAINDAVGDDDPPRAAHARALTDREAWTQLAALVPVALGDQPKALQDALVAEFMAEAQRAAG